MTEEGAWTIGVTNATTFVRSQHVQECPDIGPACNDGPQTPYRHRSTLFISSTELVAEAGVKSWLSASVTFPVRWIRTGIKNVTLEGAPYDPPDEGIHHRNETLFDHGDPIAAARLGKKFGPVLGSARIGVSLPLGTTGPDPFADGEAGIAHQHIQFGAGILQPVLGLEAFTSGPAETSLAFYSVGTLALYENQYGLRPSSRASAGAGVSRAFGESLRAGASLDAAHEFPERWSAHHHTAEGNLGRTDVTAAARATWIVSPHLAGTLGASVPLYVDTAGAQTRYPGAVVLALTWSK